MFRRSRWSGAGSGPHSAAGWDGDGTQSCPVPYSPLIPLQLRRRTFLLRHGQEAAEMYVQEPGAASIGAACWLPPPRSRCRSHGGPGEPKRPRAYTSASCSCREKGRETQAANPSLQRGAASREGAGCRRGERELELSPKKKIKEGNPYRRSRFPHGYPRGLIAHLSLHPFFILAPFWAALSSPPLSQRLGLPEGGQQTPRRG